MNYRPEPITTDQIYKSQARVNLVCGFYGPTHPNCKKAVQQDAKLYIGFMNQFKVGDTSVDKSTGDKSEPLDTLDLLQNMMRDNL
jgi:hypothetical protein